MVNHAKEIFLMDGIKKKFKTEFRRLQPANQSKCNCLVNQSELRVNTGKQTVMKFEKTQVIK